MITGTIFDIKEMAVHDGPGLRTTVFFKGCPLRCLWCHNPEGLTSMPQLMYKQVRCISCGNCQTDCSHEECRPFGRCIHACPENCLEISGRNISVHELMAELLPSAEILGDMFGGFTFSGGEPLTQSPFLLETAKLLKPYHLAIETSGYADKAIFQSMLEIMDYVIMDLKLADTEMHKKYTGVSNEKILQNFRALKESGKECLIRTPLIPGITDTHENLTAIEALVGDLPWEKLPYNAMAGAKYKMLGMEYSL